MNTFISNFKYDTKSSRTNRLNALVFDFITVALVSLTINSFIINSKSSPLDQKYLAAFGAMLIATHWHAENIFRDKYEKEKTQFYLINFAMGLSMGIMAIGMGLMMARLNQDIRSQVELRWLAPTLYVAGLIFTRVIVLMQYTFAWLANNKYRDESGLIKMKIMSRFMVIVLGIAHICILIFTKNVALTTYIFMPIYFVLEKLGNNLGINQKRVTGYEATIIYLKERYKRLTVVFISSTFISQIIQIPNYLKGVDDLTLLIDYSMNFAILFLIYLFYIKIANYSKPIATAPHLLISSWLSTIIVTSLTIIGAFLININASISINIKIPISFSISVLILGITFIFPTLNSDDSKHFKKIMIVNSLHAFIFLILGIVFVTGHDISNLAFLAIAIILLISIVIWSQIVLNKKNRV